MAANVSPIFPLVPNVSWTPVGLTNANTALDGTGTVQTIFTAGANGSRVDQITFEHLGTNVATVARIFINNGSANTTNSNNALVLEQAIASNTLSQTAASVNYVVPVSLILPSGYKLNATIGTAVAAGVKISTNGGDY